MAPALDIHDLKYRYATSAEWALDVARLELGPGEQMLLTGGSGSGKSTLLHLVCGLMEPAAGRVTVNGTDMHALRGAKRDLFRGRTIGMIFQTFNLLHGFTALENVTAAMMFSSIPKRTHRAEAEALLRHLGLDEVRRSADRLSIGQQQRVAVARAVACHPKLVLADEPTASLDPENAATAIALIKEACREQGAALLCVSHDPALAGAFERTASIDDLRATAPAGEAAP
ncbi:MAG: ABC transporter ATP-binding protein [Planctomycetota bacterium]|jgi:putative ABC transport system ATP-binding protein